MVADPLFNNEGTGDFSLRTGSPCINAASDGTHIGAWQGVVGIKDWHYKNTGIRTAYSLPDMTFNMNGIPIQKDRVSTGIYFSVDKGSNLIKKKVIIK